MRIARKFKQLTKLTYPHGTEIGLIKYLPVGYQEDGHGNYFILVGDKPSTMFTCHLDTACSTQVRVNHVHDGKYIKTDGSSILGADDKAGMTVLLYMIENKVPGLYYFFIGEEVGCVGSGRLSRNWSETEFSSYIKKVISFDRRGTNSVITEQLYGRCCSDGFARELANRLNSTEFGFRFSPDNTGIYTDSAKFTSLVPECTNISVGYYSEHTSVERQDIDFLQKLCKAACLVDWETLPIIRDFKSVSNSYWNYYYGDEDEDDDDFFYGSQNWKEQNFSYFKIGGVSKKMFISNDQISNEKSTIYSWLISTGAYTGFRSIVWNGNSLYIETANNYEYVGDRLDIIDIIPELAEVSISELREKL